MKITGLKIFVANVSRTNFVFVKLYTDDGHRRRRRGDAGVEDADRRRRTRGAGARARRPRPVRGRRHRRAAAPRQLLAHRRGVPHRARRGRGGAARHQGQGARRAGVRAARRPVPRPGRAATPTTGSSARARRRSITRRRKRGVAHGLPRAEMGSVRGVADLEMDRRAAQPHHRDRRGGARRGRTRRRPDARRPRPAQRPDRDRHVQGAGALRSRPGSRSRRRPRAIDALAEVRAASPVPIAAGERWYEPGRFLEALRQEGGRHPAARRLARGRPRRDEADRAPRAPAPHPGRAAQSGRAGDERDDAAHRGRDPELLGVRDRVRSTCPGARSSCARRCVFEDGAILAPTAPGLGVELIEEACARFPYAPHRRAALRRHDQHERRRRPARPTLTQGATLARGACPDAGRPHPLAADHLSEDGARFARQLGVTRRRRPPHRLCGRQRRRGAPTCAGGRRADQRRLHRRAALVPTRTMAGARRPCSAGTGCAVAAIENFSPNFWSDILLDGPDRARADGGPEAARARRRAGPASR